MPELVLIQLKLYLYSLNSHLGVKQYSALTVSIVGGVIAPLCERQYLKAGHLENVMLERRRELEGLIFSEKWKDLPMTKIQTKIFLHFPPSVRKGEIIASQSLERNCGTEGTLCL